MTIGQMPFYRTGQITNSQHIEKTTLTVAILVWDHVAEGVNTKHDEGQRCIAVFDSGIFAGGSTDAGGQQDGNKTAHCGFRLGGGSESDSLTSDFDWNEP